MAEPKEEAPAGEGKEAKPKAGNKTLIIIIIAVLVVLIAGGIGAYLFFSKSAKHADESKKEEITEGKEGKEPKEETKEGTKEGKGSKGGKSTLVALDSFVLNLSERGRFLKVTMQFELTDPAGATLVADKTLNPATIVTDTIPFDSLGRALDLASTGKSGKVHVVFA